MQPHFSLLLLAISSSCHTHNIHVPSNPNDPLHDTKACLQTVTKLSKYTTQGTAALLTPTLPASATLNPRCNWPDPALMAVPQRHPPDQRMGSLIAVSPSVWLCWAHRPHGFLLPGTHWAGPVRQPANGGRSLGFGPEHRQAVLPWPEWQ